MQANACLWGCRMLRSACGLQAAVVGSGPAKAQHVPQGCSAVLSTVDGCGLLGFKVALDCE